MYYYAKSSLVTSDLSTVYTNSFVAMAMSAVCAPLHKLSSPLTESHENMQFITTIHIHIESLWSL